MRCWTVICPCVGLYFKFDGVCQCLQCILWIITTLYLFFFRAGEWIQGHIQGRKSLSIKLHPQSLVKFSFVTKLPSLELEALQPQLPNLLIYRHAPGFICISLRIFFKKGCLATTCGYWIIDVESFLVYKLPSRSKKYVAFLKKILFGVLEVEPITLLHDSQKLPLTIPLACSWAFQRTFKFLELLPTVWISGMSVSRPTRIGDWRWELRSGW